MPDFTVPLDLPPGLFSDDTTFAKMGRWATATNFRFYGGRPETIGGCSNAVTSLTDETINKILAYTVSGTLNIAMAGTNLKRAAIGGAATDITPASGWTGSSTIRHCLDMWGDELLASCSGGKLFTSASGAQATEIVNAPDNISCMLVTKTRQVMALGCNEESGGAFNGRCIRWTDIEDYTDWTTSPTNNAGEYVLAGQQNIVGGCRLGDYVMVWTTGALWLGQFTGDPAAAWIFQRVADIGLTGIDAVATSSDTAYWISPDKRMFAYTPGGTPTEIPCSISRAFESASGWGDAFASTAAMVVVNRRYSEVWFFPPSSAASDVNFYIYHLNESREYPVWSKGNIEGLNGLNGGGTAIGTIIDDPLTKTAASGSTMLAFIYTNSNTRLRWVDVSTAAPALNALITSADMYLEEGRRRVMIKRFVPDLEAQSASFTLTIAARDRPRSTASSTDYTIATSDTKKDLRNSGMLFAFTFTATTPSFAIMRLGKPTLDCVTLGER